MPVHTFNTCTSKSKSASSRQMTLAIEFTPMFRQRHHSTNPNEGNNAILCIKYNYFISSFVFFRKTSPERIFDGIEFDSAAFIVSQSKQRIVPVRSVFSSDEQFRNSFFFARRYFLSNVCRFGDQCVYSHDRSTGVVNNVCQFYLKGRCNYGERCR